MCIFIPSVTFLLKNTCSRRETNKSACSDEIVNIVTSYLPNLTPIPKPTITSKLLYIGEYPVYIPADITNLS